MTKPTEWSIVFYIEENGSSPVPEFLEGLDAKTQARFLWSIEQLLFAQCTGPLSLWCAI